MDRAGVSTGSAILVADVAHDTAVMLWSVDMAGDRATAPTLVRATRATAARMT